MDEKLCYIQTMDYSVLKRNRLSRHEKTWENFKCILLNLKSQFEKATYFKNPTFFDFQEKKSYFA